MYWARSDMMHFKLPPNGDDLLIIGGRVVKNNFFAMISTKHLFLGALIIIVLVQLSMVWQKLSD